jgi:hypothetical protein
LSESHQSKLGAADATSMFLRIARRLLQIELNKQNRRQRKPESAPVKVKAGSLRVHRPVVPDHADSREEPQEHEQADL